MSLFPRVNDDGSIKYVGFHLWRIYVERGPETREVGLVFVPTYRYFWRFTWLIAKWPTPWGYSMGFKFLFRTPARRWL